MLLFWIWFSRVARVINLWNTRPEIKDSGISTSGTIASQPPMNAITQTKIKAKGISTRMKIVVELSTARIDS